jgi:rhodanese-related sulfurtransferase
MLATGACSAFDSSAPSISQQELLKQIEAKSDILILDVRTPGEYSDGHIPGAFHVDHREVETRINEITNYRNKPVIVYCYSGMRAGMVESYLIEQGFSQVKHLEGDWLEWKSNQRPSER